MRIIPTIDATKRRAMTNGAGAVLVSSALVFASLGLPAAPGYAAPAAHDAAGPAAAPAETEPEADGVLVFAADDAARTLSADDAADAVADGLKQLGMQETGRFAAADGSTVIEAAPAAGQSAHDAAAAAAVLEGVESAQPNYVYRLIDPAEGADAESGLVPDDAAVLAAIAANDPFAQIPDPGEPRNQYWLYSADFDDAWNQARTEGEVAIAVLDTGVMADHADLADNVLTQYGWDAFEGEPLYAEGQNAFNGGHGTMVAGVTAAVADNGFGMAGASFNASIVPVKVCDDNAAKPKITTKSLLSAYEYVTELARSGKANVRVINLSLGAYGSTLNDRALENAIMDARDGGIVTVCAGGNGDKVSKPNTRPIYPADFDACVAVTALDSDGTDLSWSDYNEYKDISAPGKAITAPRASLNGDVEGFASASGTSLAAPIVSGAFALMFAAEPDASVDEAKAALYASAAPVSGSDADRAQGSGSHGALDAAGAVDYLAAHRSAFSDVAADDWFFKAANYASSHGIMNGYDGAFHPKDGLTRAQAAQILYNRFGNGAQHDAAPLDDVDQNQWYAPAVNWAVATGMMEGFKGSDTFGVAAELSREQLATVMARAAKADTTAADPSAFTALPDHDATNDWARDAMVWATDEGVINGVDGTAGKRLLPQAPITRAQMAQVMMNAMESGLI